MQFKRIPAASVQTISVTTAKVTIIISKVFPCVAPVSDVTVRSVQRWLVAGIVNACIVWVACITMNVPILFVQEPFVMTVARTLTVTFVAEAGVFIVWLQWRIPCVVVRVMKDAAQSALRRRGQMECILAMNV